MHNILLKEVVQTYNLNATIQAISLKSYFIFSAKYIWAMPTSFRNALKDNFVKFFNQKKKKKDEKLPNPRCEFHEDH